MFDLIYPPSPAEVLPKPTAENPVAPATGGSEMLPVIRENGLVYAQASRAYCHVTSPSRASSYNQQV